MTILPVNIWTYSVYKYCVYSIHTFYTRYLLLLSQKKYNRITSIAFGTVHSNRTVVVLLYKHFSSFCNSISTITNSMYAIISESNIRHMSTVCSPFLSWFITSNFSLILIVLYQFFTRIALSDAYLCFSLILIAKANPVEGGTTSATYHQHNQSIHVTVTSLSASLQHKTRVATDRACQIMLKKKCIVYAKSH